MNISVLGAYRIQVSFSSQPDLHRLVLLVLASVGSVTVSVRVGARIAIAAGLAQVSVVGICYQLSLSS